MGVNINASVKSVPRVTSDADDISAPVIDDAKVIGVSVTPVSVCSIAQ
jgi:hypothetical protein